MSKQKQQHEQVPVIKVALTQEFLVGTHVVHTNLKLVGTVVKPVGLGVDTACTLVEFVDDETREVSTHLLQPLASPPFPHPENEVNRNDLTCPRCKIGKNGGGGSNEKCFHCDTCDYVECIFCPCNWS